jgi:propionate CoA-transferase
MSFFLKAQTAVQLIRWKRNVNKFLLDYPPPVNTGKFMTARQAAGLIPDDAVVMSTGMTGTMRPAVLYRAVRTVFESTGHPRRITWITAGGAGGRGRVPGTVEEIAAPGLLKHFVSGHLETARHILDMGAKGQCELSVLPQGTITHLAEAQARGEGFVLSDVGVDTFMDPRVGNGSLVIPGTGTQLVSVQDDQLRYTLPGVSVACVIGSAADEEGNIYQTGAPILAESREAARAARRNGGLVIVTVGGLVPKNESQIFLRADEVDAVVVNPRQEVALAVPQTRPWPALLPGANEDVARAMAKVQVLNSMTKLDPTRSTVDRMLARQAAHLFQRICKPGVRCIIGYGLPQEVGRLIHEGGLGRQMTFLIETGVYGGVPAPGIFFGMAFNPERLMTSAEMFHYCEEHLDVTILGMLQVDEEGNVNVSRKSDDPAKYIGPGGFQNLATCAKKIIFVGAFSARSKLVLEGGRLTLQEPGISKFVKKVDEVTFSAKAALRAGKEVYYVTPLGAFKLTDRGLELIQTAPGIDILRDIQSNAQMTLQIPDGDLPQLGMDIMTGEGFRLSW